MPRTPEEDPEHVGLTAGPTPGSASLVDPAQSR
jgi:hypothetical protein